MVKTKKDNNMVKTDTNTRDGSVVAKKLAGRPPTRFLNFTQEELDALQERFQLDDPNPERRNRKLVILNYYQNTPIQKFAGYAAGISEETFSTYKQDDQLFLDTLNRLDADYVNARLDSLKGKDEKWVLERMYRKQFAPPTVQLSGPDEGPIQFTKLTDEQLDAVIASKAAKVGVPQLPDGEGTQDQG